MKVPRLAAGMAAKFLLGKVTRRPEPARREARDAERAARPRPHADPKAPRGPLFVVMAGSIGIAAPLMFFLHSTPARIAGVLLLFTFIIAGVFAIADPRFLDDGREAEHR